jgi:hypothetical protein
MLVMVGLVRLSVSGLGAGKHSVTRFYVVGPMRRILLGGINSFIQLNAEVGWIAFMVTLLTFDAEANCGPSLPVSAT